jgi:hypothetical protein
MRYFHAIVLSFLSIALPVINAVNQGNFQSSSSFGDGNGFQSRSTFSDGNGFVSSSGSHQIIQSNGNNNVVISRRMNADNVQEDYISMSNPKIIIDGEYCK